MSKKKSMLAPPSQQALQLVMQQAASAPLQNMQHAAQVNKALEEVATFFRALLGPQSTSERGAASSGSSSVKPQASDNAGGN